MKSPKSHRGIFQKLFNEKIEDKESLEKKLKKLEDQTEILLDRFLEGDITKEVYDNRLQKWAKEKATILAMKPKTPMDLSNLEKYIQFTLRLCSKLATMWASSGRIQKMQLQKLIFPEGTRYNKEKSSYRTTRINSLFAAIPYAARVLDQSKKGTKGKITFNSLLVSPEVI